MWLIVSIIIYILALFYFNGGWRRKGEAPIERGFLPWIGDIFRYGNNTGAYLEKMRAKHGEVFSVFILGKVMIHPTNISDFATIHRVSKNILSFEPVIGLIEKNALYIKDLQLAKSLHDQTKKGYTKYLSGEALVTLTKTSNDITRKYFKTDIVTGNVLLLSVISRFVYDVVSETMLGTQFPDSQNYEAFKSYDGIFHLLAAGMPISWMSKITKLRDILFSSLANKKDNVSQFIQERNQLFNSHGMTPNDISGSQLGVFWASLANTIPATFWTLYYIIKDKDLLQTIKEEIFKVVKDPMDIQFSEIKKLVQLEAVIFETLRITTASYSVREAVADTQIPLESGNNLEVKKGQRICLSSWLIHRDPRIYNNPETFIYDRFLGVDPGNILIPFGGGISMCPGRFLALNEIKIFIIYLLSNYNIQLLHPEKNIKFNMQRFGIGVLPPQEDVWVNIQAI